MRVSIVYAVAAASAALLVAAPALAGDDPAESGWRQVAYSCESGQALTVAFRQSGGAVEVTTANYPAVKLVSRPAKSGFRYSDSRYELRGEGDALTWQVGSRTPLKCTSHVAAAAKLAAATG